VVTQIEFESMLRRGLKGVSRIVMIQCVGSRNAARPYCSRVCCTATVRNTIAVMQSLPGTEITVLSRWFAQYVGDLDRARQFGVAFVRYDPKRPPKVGDASVEVYDVLSATERSIPYDLVVLAAPLVARDETRELATALGLPVDDHGLVAQPHVRLRPTCSSPPVSSAAFICRAQPGTPTSTADLRYRSSRSSWHVCSMRRGDAPPGGRASRGGARGASGR